MLISSGCIFTDTLQIMFYQLSGQPFAQSGWHRKLTLIRNKSYICSAPLSTQQWVFLLYIHSYSMFLSILKHSKGFGTKSKSLLTSQTSSKTVSPLLMLLQSHESSVCSTSILHHFLLQGLCTCYSDCLKCSSSDHDMTELSIHISITNVISERFSSITLPDCPQLNPLLFSSSSFCYVFSRVTPNSPTLEWLKNNIACISHMQHWVCLTKEWICNDAKTQDASIWWLCPSPNFCLAAGTERETWPRSETHCFLLHSTGWEWVPWPHNQLQGLSSHFPATSAVWKKGTV